MQKQQHQCLFPSLCALDFAAHRTPRIVQTIKIKETKNNNFSSNIALCAQWHGNRLGRKRNSASQETECGEKYIIQNFNAEWLNQCTR